jgi:hypothetical protein
MANQIEVTSLAAQAASSIDGNTQLVAFTQAGDTTRLPFIEAVAQANISNGDESIKTVSLTISTADVLTLNATPVPFGLTVAAGTAIYVMGTYGKLTYNSATYATNGNLLVRSVGTTAPQAAFTANGFLFGTTTRISTGTMTGGVGVTDDQLIDGADIECYVSTGNPTAGDSDITIYVTYRIITL